MFPLPPLDGGRVALSVLPNALARPFAKLERFGFLVLLGIIFLLPMLGRSLGVDLNIFRWFVAMPLAWLLPLFRDASQTRSGREKVAEAPSQV
jgi:Zn-dependent protease